MKNSTSLTLLASLVVVTSLSSTKAYADYEQQKDTQMKNEQRADGQAYKANRDAARGDFRGAEKHRANMALDEYKVQRDSHRANRDLRRGDY